MSPGRTTGNGSSTDPDRLELRIRPLPIRLVAGSTVCSKTADRIGRRGLSLSAAHGFAATEHRAACGAGADAHSHHDQYADGLAE